MAAHAGMMGVSNGIQVALENGACNNHDLAAVIPQPPNQSTIT